MTLQWLHKVGELRFLSVHSPKVYEKTKHVVEGRKQAQEASGAETLPGTASQVPVSTAQEEPHFWTSNNHNDLAMYEDSSFRRDQARVSRGVLYTLFIT